MAKILAPAFTASWTVNSLIPPSQDRTLLHFDRQQRQTEDHSRRPDQRDRSGIKKIRQEHGKKQLFPIEQEFGYHSHHNDRALFHSPYGYADPLP